jgi:hypothetical protein
MFRGWAFSEATSEHHQILLATHCLVSIKLSKTPSLYTFSLKMATVMLAETSGNSTFNEAYS